MKLTYKQIHKLISKGVDLKVNTPFGIQKIVRTFNKKDEGYIITFNDNSKIKCAVTHTMQFEGKMLSAKELRIGFKSDFSNKVITDIQKVPSQEWFDFEIEHEDGLYFQNDIIHHNSGKSLSISLIIDFLVKHNKKVLLLVPNINLLTQFKSDIKSYNLNELYDNTDLLGGGNECNFDKSLLISTWQSLIKYKEEFTTSRMNWDCIICDECHRFSSEETSEIVATTENTKMRLGFTGTVPDSQTALYTLIGLFGDVKTYIRACELIDRGLGTPININTVVFDYTNEFKNLLKNTKNYSQQLKLIKECENRNNFIENLSIKLMDKGENNLVLYSHTEHGKTLFLDIVNKLFPNLEVANKDITGKKSFEFQEKIGVYFINGEDDAKTREKTRKVLEETYVEFDYNDEHYRINEKDFTFNKDECSNFKKCGSILISNYAILSTGVNIKQLHNMILASPLKSYTTITQSIGRGMRLHETKSVFNVFDLVDNLGIRKPSGVFYKQYKHRVSTSYNPEGYRIKERIIKL